MQTITFSASDIEQPEQSGATGGSGKPITFSAADIQAPDFSTSNQKDASGNASVDPNTLGTLVSHFAAQVNPIGAVQTIGKALMPEWSARLINKADQAIFGSKPLSDAEASTYGPLNAASHLGAAHGAVFDEAKAAYAKGDYLTAARKFVNYLTPLAGPGIDKSSDLFQAGKWAAGGGDALGIGLVMFGPEALKHVTIRVPALAKNQNPAEAAAVAFGEQRGIPVDAATATGNRFIRSAQGLADHSPIGSVVAERGKAAQASALTKVSGELAHDARGVAITPEQAGQGIRDALTSKVQAHKALADHSYDSLRALEADPTNRISVALPPEAVDQLPGPIQGQLRRIVHEMDASGYSDSKLVRGAPGERDHYVPRSGGAKVYDDITQNLGYNPTRSAIQRELEEYLGGGKETAAVKAAINVAKTRYRGNGSEISTPELPASAMQVPTRLEGARVTSQEMGLPVDVAAAKKLLRPVYDAMQRQMPLTQRQASPGLQAIENILTGPDMAPLSQIDRDLSAIKALAREHGGLAKFAVSKLDAAVKQAASYGTPDVMRSLEQGRRATIGKVTTADLIEALPGGTFEEPLAVFKRATAPKDSGIDFLRAVTTHAPQAAPQLARAYLEDLFGQATAEGGFNKALKLDAEWRKLGTETKKILFPQAGQTQALDHFFLLAKKIAESPNPSQSGLVVSTGAQIGLTFTHPMTGVPVMLGSGVLSSLLRSRVGVQALTRGMSLSLKGNRVGAAMEFLRATTLAGDAQPGMVAPLAVPAAAGTEPRR